MADNSYVYGIRESDGGKFAYAEKFTVDNSNERDAAAQLRAGGDLREPGDDGMHLIPRKGNGAKGEENLIAGDRSINRGSYKSMENSVIKAAENNPEGNVSMRVDTFGGVKRPDVIQVEIILTDKDGNVIDRENASWSNQSKELKAGQYYESGTDFPGYKENLSEEERAIADAVQEKIDSGAIKINTGLDTGWQYRHFDMEDQEMSKAHADFVGGLKVEVNPVVSEPQGGADSESGGREREDGPGMGGRDNDFKGGPTDSTNTVPVGAATNDTNGPSEAMANMMSSVGSEPSFPEAPGSAIESLQAEASAGLDDTSEASYDFGGEAESGIDSSGVDNDGMAGP